MYFRYWYNYNHVQCMRNVVTVFFVDLVLNGDMGLIFMSEAT